jgi:transcriptional regulator with XRE-family HTH domain
VPIRLHISKNVQRVRKAHRFTQATLAEAAETTTETVSRIERGILEPSASLLARLATALGVSMDTLAGLAPSKGRLAGPEPEVRRILRHLRGLEPRAVRRIAAVVQMIPPSAKSTDGRRR